MLVHFWGVRGSIPSPLTSDQIQSKITAVVERITSEDLVSEDSRMKFIANLPKWIYGTVGGNSPCVQVISKAGDHIILDGGSGIRCLAKKGVKPSDKHYHLFFSHFHWDHIQGIPFFDPIYDSGATIDIYSNYRNMEEFLEKQNGEPYFPPNADWRKLNATIRFHVIEEGQPVKIGNVIVNTHKMKHPGDSYSISIEEDGKKVIYCTDVELQNSDFDLNNPRNYFFDKADAIIFDSQYTADEAIVKENWGHSSFCFGIDFAHTWNIKKVFMFHHEPTYDDKKLMDMVEMANWYIDYKQDCKIDLDIAVEGQEIEF